MLDLLKYRIPGEEPIEKKGRFEVLTADAHPTGFIVGNFDLSILYTFTESPEGSATPSLFYSETLPFVVSNEEYLQQAAVFLAQLQQQQLKKAVFSRIKAVEHSSIDGISFFDELSAAYPSAFVYLISSKQFGTWIGATPEILIQADGNEAKTMSLAGTKALSDATEWGEKELSEQQYVTDFIESRLVEKGIDHIHLSERYTVNAGPVKHLRTDISFNLSGKPILEVVKYLHPTPAVSGLPQKEAIKLIETEMHQRAFYAGVIGLIASEQSRVFVNLRCCQLQKHAAYLYLGGGFTKDSVPELEWEETENKSKTLLNILQNQ